MYAPCIRPDAENCSVRNLPKRDELLFHTVLRNSHGAAIGVSASGVSACAERSPWSVQEGSTFIATGATHGAHRALPKFSMMGFVWSTRWCRSPPAVVATAARYCSRILAVSVFPAPDSPEMITDWEQQQEQQQQ